jgi:hypothetical protein
LLSAFAAAYRIPARWPPLPEVMASVTPESLYRPPRV